ncbi:MAG: hypothetical protein JWN86_2712 [Planctomycetota bacterium]|nr:hypothetical protein [Planctomycetota bacterium]
MIVPFVESVIGTAVYVNPEYVVMLRPDPESPDAISILKLSDGETLRVNGEHHDVAGKLSPSP